MSDLNALIRDDELAKLKAVSGDDVAVDDRSDFVVGALFVASYVAVVAGALVECSADALVAFVVVVASKEAAGAGASFAAAVGLVPDVVASFGVVAEVWEIHERP